MHDQPFTVVVSCQQCDYSAEKAFPTNMDGTAARRSLDAIQAGVDIHEQNTGHDATAKIVTP